MISKVIRIGQVSDIHIGEDEGFVQGIDVRANFESALKSKSMKDIDLLVLSGDLANEDGEEGAYKYVADLLKDYRVPVCVIPGNHDRLDVMQKYFDLEGKVRDGKCYYRYDICGRTLLFLDSGCGTVSKDQLDWLKVEAAKVNDEILLFMHHPPCLCNHRFMDLKYSLKNIDEVQETLSSIKNIKHIFTGHYHFNFHLQLPSQQEVHVAPSTQMQIDPQAPIFNLMSSAPGWQVIEWGENFVETGVYFN
ncbi:MAG: metallophosphoesterase [Fibrobacter sp.]|jgi:Icc protein|uniref:metallophosphoesterase family protein n=1 Tax=uncultured Fibrobacter sp. TaxID=261512 RepID=UPI0025E0B103|nr:metallophosphoesterase [uncultured Fibrobacter sp.]MBO4713677.1 metallophosphoesterase [Fibrobacter sp.]MBO4829224.1 metallophosphoesterase [Fibrobacter sp.]